MTITIDAKNLVVGRLATYAAKKALLGETVFIVNSEKAVITGKPPEVYKRFKQKTARGTPSTGPFFHRSADRLLRRSIRGMLPYKQAKGAEAFKRVMCFNGVPAKFKDAKLETIKSADISKVTKANFVRLGDVVKLLGR